LHTIADIKDSLLNNASRLQISEDLTEFPPEIFELADTLEVLDLSDNQLSELPAEFPRLSKLKILFLSDNQFVRLPTVLADCQQLEIISFKRNKLEEIPENSLPQAIRCLVLTANTITKLPDSIGDLKSLQKIMLAGNQLTNLPETMQHCRALQLMRLSANQLIELPDFLFKMPKLAWLAFAGNPCCLAFSVEGSGLPGISISDIELHETLGQGASGIISRATLRETPEGLDNLEQSVAVKIYKGMITSDGYSSDEMAACIAAGKHPNLPSFIAKITGTEESGLVMNLIPQDYTILGEPPTLQSITRDHFDDDFMLTVAAAHKIAKSVADTMLHLLERGISHGDLYAHNILTNEAADVLLSDFGAASNYASLSAENAAAMQSVEVRAFGCLLEDMLGSSCDSDECEDLFEPLVLLKNRCMHPNVAARPTFADIKSELVAL
jgi:hypothetical protein